jgi:hypothetical protein
MKVSTVGLVEIAGSHDECLLSQMYALSTANVKIVFVSTKEMIDRNPAFKKYVDVFVEVDTSNKRATASQVWNELKKNQCDKVVFNTAQGKLVRAICWKALFHKMEFIGIIHTTRMFTESFTQKLISKKIKKYLLLSDFLLSKVQSSTGAQLEAFYPLRFASKEKPRVGNENTVVIIGGVESRRKDLGGFVQMVGGLSTKDVRFVFLGKSDPSNPEVKEFLGDLEKKGLTKNVETYNTYVPQEEFDTVLQNADLILPLVHPNTPSAEQYFRNQISGAMTVSFGYKIPMLIHEAYEHIEEMQMASSYYSLERFDQELELALSNLDEKKDKIRLHQHYDVDYQEKKYVSFVLG